jgi:hypothetical protein
MMKLCWAVAQIALLATALTGCTGLKEWSYDADARTARVPVLARRVVVPPLKDLRSRKNRNSGAFAVLVPLWLYGTAEYNRPERLDIWGQMDVEPPEPMYDVAKAIAEELDHSGLFAKVVYSESDQGGDLVLNGDLIALKDDRWNTCYGLTIFLGQFLWIMGAPSGGTTQELTLKLSLVERGTGRTLWSETLTGSDSKTEWLYSLKYGLRHPGLLKTQMRQAINSLEATLSK